eukprot:Filipodium_phascolosomae@DN4765_c0_g1_i1.p1
MVIVGIMCVRLVVPVQFTLYGVSCLVQAILALVVLVAHLSTQTPIFDKEKWRPNFVTSVLIAAPLIHGLTTASCLVMWKHCKGHMARNNESSGLLPTMGAQGNIHQYQSGNPVEQPIIATNTDFHPFQGEGHRLGLDDNKVD